MFRESERGLSPADPRTVPPPPNVAITRGCFMTQGLYLKANGELPCWDDVGESHILRKLSPAALANGEEINISTTSSLNHIRLF